MNQLHGVPWPVWLLVAAGVAYPIVARILLIYAHPKRLRIQQLIGELFADARLSSQEKSFLRYSEEMNGRSWPILIGVVVLPIVAIEKMFGIATRSNLPTLREDPRYQELNDLQVRCMMAANPIVGIVFAVELFVVLLPAILHSRGKKGWEQLRLGISERLSQMLQTQSHFGK